MGQIQNSGKKRRSLSFRKFLERIDAVKYFDYEALPHLLIAVFNKYQAGAFNFKDEKLKNDIKTCVQIFEKLETIGKDVSKSSDKSVAFRMTSKQKSYPLEIIKDINKIMARSPLYLQLDFEANMRLVSKTKSFINKKSELKEFYQDITNKVAGRSKKKLPHLRFAAFTNHLCLGGLDYPEDKDTVRSIMARGLFAYFQGIILGQKSKIIRCQNKDCGIWFLSLKKNHLTCSQQCYEPYWREKRGGREYRAKQMQKLRNPDNVARQ